MLSQRLFFGFLLIAGLLGCLYADELLTGLELGGGWRLAPGAALLLLIAVALVGAVGELAAMFRIKDKPFDGTMVVLGSMALILATYVHGMAPGLDLAALAPGLLVAAWVAALIRYSVPGHRTEGALVAGGTAALGLVYLGVLPCFFIMLRLQVSAMTLAGIVLVVKSCDTGAYFVGRSMGKRKLIPWLSPGKTWEGLAGGLLASAATAALLAVLVNRAGGLGPPWNPAAAGVGQAVQAAQAVRLPVWAAALAGVLLGAVGHVGDLLKSLMKRDAGIKDSGKSLPGFGGFLDVIDSPLLACPVAYALIRLAGG